MITFYEHECDLWNSIDDRKEILLEVQILEQEVISKEFILNISLVFETNIIIALFIFVKNIFILCYKNELMMIFM